MGYKYPVKYKRYYYTFDNSLLNALRAFRTLHKSFHAAKSMPLVSSASTVA